MTMVMPSVEDGTTEDVDAVETDGTFHKSRNDSAAADKKPAKQQQQPVEEEGVSIILFYKYHPLSNDFTVMEEYRLALERLCQALQLTGRILVGCSETEGLNGTLAGPHGMVKTFTYTMQRRKPELDDDRWHDPCHSSTATEIHHAVETFWTASEQFFAKIQQPELIFESESDFKWSSCSSSGIPSSTPTLTNQQRQQQLFPDLNIKLTKELIGSGGAMLDIPVEETAKGYLTPLQWHDELTKLRATTTTSEQEQPDTVLIDCRNTKEHEIGHFPGALDPRTTNYSQFSHWVNENQTLLEGKKVLMYCTGGIRCEKASAYIRRQVPNVQQVQHLKGGIHKYLEEYGNTGLWQGKNFVFDARQAASAEATRCGKEGAASSLPILDSSHHHHHGLPRLLQTSTSSNNRQINAAVAADVVGQCLYCQQPYDTFEGHTVCAVCREPVLVCRECQGGPSARPERQHRSAIIKEYHCRQHFHLKDCYFANLSEFTVPELRQQLALLQREYQRISVGRRFKQKRQTLSRQSGRILKQIQANEAAATAADNTVVGDDVVVKTSNTNTTVACRNCDAADCEGNCWGFFGLKRKEMLEKQQQKNSSADALPSPSLPNTPVLKKPRRGVGADELRVLQYHQPPSSFQHSITTLSPPLAAAATTTTVIDTSNNNQTIRCPPCVTRVVQSFAKAKWCGKSVLNVLTHEFAEFASPSSSSSEAMTERQPSSSLQASLNYGLIKLNQASVSPLEACHTKLKNGDLLGRVLHWHEPPVLAPCYIPVQKVLLPPSVCPNYALAESEAFVYVCSKPSSVPVHPAGPYLANTLTVMIEAQEGMESRSLKPIHRTDRATSGLTLLSTSATVAKIFHKCLSESTVEKLYIAKVCGTLPNRQALLETMEHAQANDDGGKKSCLISWNENNCSIQVDAPIFTPDPISGIRIISDKGKPSKSFFKLLRYDASDDTSIVACQPVTGRNHQLRVHLQALGCPIVGDVQYDGRPCTKETIPMTTVMEIMKRCASHKPDSESRLEEIDTKDINAARKVCPNCNPDKQESGQQREVHGQLNFTDSQLIQGGHTIYLHALKYRVTFLNRKNKQNYQEELAEYTVGLPGWAGSDCTIPNDIFEQKLGSA